MVVRLFKARAGSLNLEPTKGKYLLRNVARAAGRLFEVAIHGPIENLLNEVLHDLADLNEDLKSGGV